MLEDISSELYYFADKHGYSVETFRNLRDFGMCTITIIEEVIDKLEETKSFIEDAIELLRD